MSIYFRAATKVGSFLFLKKYLRFCEQWFSCWIVCFYLERFQRKLLFCNIKKSFWELNNFLMSFYKRIMLGNAFWEEFNFFSLNSVYVRRVIHLIESRWPNGCDLTMTTTNLNNWTSLERQTLNCVVDSNIQIFKIFKIFKKIFESFCCDIISVKF